MNSCIEIAINALIKPFEGYHKALPDGGCSSYPDPGTGGAPWTIGWGSTGPDIDKTTVWTRQKAEDRLVEEVEYFYNGLLKQSPILVSALPRRTAALISFCYNCGLGNYRISTLRKRVNEEDWSSATSEIVRWNKAAGRVLPGLTRRRQAEAAFLR